MKKVFLAAISLFCCMAASAATINYTADDSSIFPNPERGFYYHMEQKVSEKSPYCVKGKESSLTAHTSSDCGTLVLVLYYLDNFRTTATIPSKVLNAFDEDMQALRNNGMKCVLRFAYTNGTYGSGSSESAKDATLAIALQHLSQYKSHLHANADVIYVVQAGIVGAWGEWYYSDNFGNQTGHINQNRRILLDSLLKAVPADRCIQVRTPLFKTEYIGSTAALTEAEAWKNTAKARIGHHNDAFMWDYDNMGTYTDTAKQKPYLAQETLYVPVGGESDVYVEEYAAQWGTYAKTTAEMSRLHWTYINKGYAGAILTEWKNNGAYNEMNRKMGYRYQLVNATLPDQATAGGKAVVKINLKNVGYAPLYNERHAYIVLKNGNTSYRIQLQSDPRTWKPNGVQTTINEQITIPSNVANGTYQMYLYLPDAYASIASNPAYAVRFANANVWEASTGMNKLNASITISGGGDTPQPTDAIQLPALLNKANVASYSENMTWYNTNYFDFGPDDAENLDGWAEWNVYLKYPGEYNVTMVGYYPNGHEWQIELVNSGAETFGTERTWTQGDLTEEGVWDLSDVPAGIYTLRVKNIFEWSQSKLLSIDLQYNGTLPPSDGIEETEAVLFNGQAYDILGRPVDENYHGIVIQNGKKRIQ